MEDEKQTYTKIWSTLTRADKRMAAIAAAGAYQLSLEKVGYYDGADELPLDRMKYVLFIDHELKMRVEEVHELRSRELTVISNSPGEKGSGPERTMILTGQVLGGYLKKGGRIKRVLDEDAKRPPKKRPRSDLMSGGRKGGS